MEKLHPRYSASQSVKRLIPFCVFGLLLNDWHIAPMCSSTMLVAIYRRYLFFVGGALAPPCHRSKLKLVLRLILNATVNN